MTDLVIVGAGGHAREILDTVEALNAEDPTYRLLGFIADQEKRPELAEARGVKILGGIDLLGKLDAVYAIGIGDLKARKRIDDLASDAGMEPATLVHPSAQVGGQVELGPGTYLAPGAVLTTNIRLGRHAHVNVGASISHDCVIGKWSLIGPGARVAGNVTLGNGVEIGIGAVVRPGVSIGDWALIGAGAAVVADVEAENVVAGVPAKPL